MDSELVVLDNIVDASMAAASEAVSVDAGDQGVAQLGQEFYDQLSIRLGERLRECGQRVPVVTGECLLAHRGLDGFPVANDSFS